MRQNRATNHGPTRDIPEHRLSSVAAHQWVLQTDFARFFASIYTHSIPWAIDGKQFAKAHRKGGPGNALDRAVRDGQDRQTIGIPVGPDSSHVISELIASAVDSLAFKRAPTGFRHVDDYFLCFDKESDAITALERLAGAAREFELDLNYEKTSIKTVRDLTDAVGLDTLRDFAFSDLTSVSRKELHRYFALATDLISKQETALKYAVRVLSERDISNDDWETFESYLLRSVTLSPNCIDYVAYTLVWASLRAAPIDASRIRRFFVNQVATGLAYNRHSEVAWSLWLMKNLGYTIPKQLAARLGNSESSIVALLALDLRDKGLVAGSINVTNWESLVNKRELFGERWLLAYESEHKGWLRPAAPSIATDPAFDQLHAKGVYFYDDSLVQRVSSPTGLVNGETPGPSAIVTAGSEPQAVDKATVVEQPDEAVTLAGAFRWFRSLGNSASLSDDAFALEYDPVASDAKADEDIEDIY